jgi:hypothetical protein
MKTFNVAGPCNATKHYMIEPSERLSNVIDLIENEYYLLIHAPRQSGKTTYIQDLVNRLNASGNYYAVYCSVEIAREIEDPKIGIPAIVKRLKQDLFFTNIPNCGNFAKNADFDDFANVLNFELKKFCMSLDKPLIILFDEVDSMRDGTLLSFISQLRDGYINRNMAKFVHSVALVGMRNIRDYKVQIRPENKSLGSASPFNIVTKVFTLANFTKEEVTKLYAQHTAATKQQFEDAAITYIYEQTQGQPWLVNAVAREIIVEQLKKDYSITITAEMAREAIQTIILRRDTHIDSLLERLKEERVRDVIEPLIVGGYVDVTTDDFYYVRDLGLIKVEKDSKIIPANPIYSELIFRALNQNVQETLNRSDNDYKMPRYLKNGKIDMNFLMADFQQFWRENCEIWTERFMYKEAAPHLVLTAFLQRIINGGGQVIREPAVGKGRLDIYVIYDNIKYPIELKIRYDTKTLPEGLTQLAKYMDTIGTTEGWLCIFDKRKTKPWKEKIYTKTEIVENKTIFVVGM